jgi:hypothetical protein
MKRMRLLEINFLFGIIFLCGSCSINIVGKYSSNKSSISFQLNKDSTFIYEYRSYHLYQFSRGKWERVERDRISLTSDIENTTVPISIKEIDHNDNTNNSIISLNLNIEKSRSLADYMCGVYINDALFCIRRCDSVTFIPVTVPVESCYFHFTKEPEISSTTAVSPPLFTKKYNNKYPIIGKKIIISVDFNDSYFFYKAFNKDTIRVKKHAIKIFNSDSKKWEKIPRVSDELNIFSRFIDTFN